MIRALNFAMLMYLLFTGQFIWFLAFGGALIVWEVLQWDERMYQRRTQKRRLAGN